MSLWPRSELRVVVSPEQVLLLPLARGGFGAPSVLPDAQCVSVHGPASSQPWRAALLALEGALARAPKKRSTVVLSNHFLRYALVPWRDGLTGEDEELSYARHCFSKVYGKAALQWQIRLSDERAPAARLACAVDGDFIEALKGVFECAGVPLHSIQPHLQVAFNAARRHLRRNAWLVVVEPGLMMLALLQQGRWQSVRSVRVDEPWRDALPIALEREAYRADAAALAREVYVWNADPADASLPKNEGWQFYALAPRPPAGSPVLQASHFASALAA